MSKTKISGLCGPRPLGLRCCKISFHTKPSDSWFPAPWTYSQIFLQRKEAPWKTPAKRKRGTAYIHIPHWPLPGMMANINKPKQQQKQQTTINKKWQQQKTPNKPKNVSTSFCGWSPLCFFYCHCRILYVLTPFAFSFLYFSGQVEGTDVRIALICPCESVTHGRISLCWGLWKRAVLSWKRWTQDKTSALFFFFLAQGSIPSFFFPLLHLMQYDS